MAEHLTINWPDMAARAAYMAAAAAAGVLDDPEYANGWPWFGGPMGTDAEGEVLTQSRVQTMLFGFVLANPAAPAEALFRFAAARGLHHLEADAWPDLERHFRVAYEVFAHLAPILHKRFGELAAIEWAEEHYPSSDSPPLASALTDVPIEDTILAPHPDPLATNPNMVLVIQQSGAAAAITETHEAEAREALASLELDDEDANLLVEEVDGLAGTFHLDGYAVMIDAVARIKATASDLATPFAERVAQIFEGMEAEAEAKAAATPATAKPADETAA